MLDLEDEFFGEAAISGRVTVNGRELRGTGALIHALEENRTGRLGDIIGTIQAEQDEIIRSPLPGVLIVQGGPGTGKTVVALHRAAFLLYAHRFPLEGQGVLVYLRQEGRGIGLQQKIHAYNLQDAGHDTVDANLLLGHQADERDYTVAVRILEELKGEGTAPPLILATLAEQIRSLLLIHKGLDAGKPMMQLMREARVWGDRQRLMENVARRTSIKSLTDALLHAAKIDRISKGVAKGDTWNELTQLGQFFTANKR